jgi:nicotinamidase-related amidase
VTSKKSTSKPFCPWEITSSTGGVFEPITRALPGFRAPANYFGIFVPKGLPEGQPIAEIGVRDNEIVLPKSSSGVFNSTNIDYVLRNLGIRYLIVAGVVTDQCVDMAVRDAADRGYLVSVPGDACATYTQERHDNALKAYGGYCWVTDTNTVVARIKAIGKAAA